MTPDRPLYHLDTHLTEYRIPQIINIENPIFAPIQDCFVALDVREVKALQESGIIDAETADWARTELARLDMGKTPFKGIEYLASAFEGQLDWVLIEKANEKIQSQDGFNLVIIEYSIKDEEEFHPAEYHYLFGWISNHEIEVLKQNASMILGRVYIEPTS